MRKLYTAFMAPAFLLSYTIIIAQGSSSHMQGPPVGPRNTSAYSNIVNINGADGFYVKKDLYLIKYTLINGDRVLGVPFLFDDWLEGSISTPDGRVYTDYKLKYNAQNQTVCFLNGTDSMDVNEEVKEFTLKSVHSDSLITSRFVNSNQYQKGKSFYYEVLLDNEKGQLLKTNRKKIATSGEGIIASSTTKYLELESDYSYFDKKTKKISKIKPDTDMRSVLHLSQEDADDLHIDSFDTTDEQSLLKLMKLYFEKSKLKGF